MKTMSSILMLALLLLSSLAVTGLAGQQKGKPKGEPPSYKPDKPQREPKEKDPDAAYEYIPLDCKTSFQSKLKPPQLNEPTTWTFHGEVINKTGKVIPKGAVIQYAFSANGLPGHFQSPQSGELTLPVALAANGNWFLGSAVFVTTKEPVNLTCTGVYKKKK